MPCNDEPEETLIMQLHDLNSPAVVDNYICNMPWKCKPSYGADSKLRFSFNTSIQRQ